MKAGRPAAILLAAFLAGAGAGAEPGAGPGAGNEALAAELKQVNHELDEALVRGDGATAGGIYADRFFRVSTDGQMLTRAQVMAALAPRAGGTSFESRDVAAYDYGDTIVLVYHAIRHQQVDGKPQPDFHFRVTDTFVKQGGRWRKAVSAGTPIRSPGG